MSDCSRAPIGELLCASYGARPHIALCLGGQARTFPNELVYRSLAAHVVQALAAHVVLFACLISEDGQPWQVRATAAQSATAVRAALSHLSEGLEAQHVQLDEGLCSASRSRPGLHSCSGYTRHPDAPPPGSFGKTLFTADYLRSFEKQLDYKLSCMRSVEAHERRHALAFRAILFARPDLTWYRPLPPWCFLDWTQPVRKLDWAFLIPRAHAEAALRAPHAAYHDCKRDFNASATSIEKWLFAFWREEARIEWRDDSELLPAQLTRANTRDFAMCHRFQYPGWQPATQQGLCAAATSGNPCNALPK